MVNAIKVNLLEKQLQLSLSPTIASPEADMMISIIGRAAADMLSNPQDICTKLYLQGNIPPAELLGIDSDYVRLLLKKIGINICA